MIFSPSYEEDGSFSLYCVTFALHTIGEKIGLEDLYGDSPRFSTVPTTTDILVPETLLKKQTADAQATADAAAKQLALKKASILIICHPIYIFQCCIVCDELGQPIRWLA